VSEVVSINRELVESKIDQINLLGDCVETVYNQLEESSIKNSIKKIVDSKTKPEDFEILKNIAKGGYGEVFLVKKERILAMKRVSKDLVLNQPHTALFMAEKEVLVDAIGSDWLVSAEMTIQDSEYLYYLMDFIPGGDFMGLLSKEDVLEEDWVRFYVVEMVAALDELHSLGWIHRDLKPDNILIGLDGHIKLADFGSCIKMEGGKARSSITVGTPDYVSPDILTSKSTENEYTETLDFWTLGVIIYEMIYGVTPFYSNTLVETYRKITEVDFIFPFKIGENLKDLIQKLICRKEERLDILGIKTHPFFSGIDWNKVKEMHPPFIPEIKGEYDTSHFVDTNFEIEKGSRSSRRDKFLPFVGFTFDPKLVELLHLGEAPAKSTTKQPSTSTEESTLADSLLALEKQIKNTKNEIKEKQNELKGILMCVLSEREELDNIEKEIEEKTNKLRKIEQELQDIERIDEKRSIANAEDRKDIDTVNVMEMLNSNYEACFENIKNLKLDLVSLLEIHHSLVDSLTTSNRNLQDKVSLLEAENAKIKKVGVDSLKKQLRILTGETKEYQQKLNQEILLRKSLEEELKSIKNSKAHSIPSSRLEIEFPCRLLSNRNLVSSIKIVEDTFYLNDTSHPVNFVYLLDLKNNELHHESYKARSLIIKVIFIKEICKSVSSVGRRNLKSLEEDLKVELSMLSGLEKMMPLLSGKPLEEASMQLAGSQKKISQLKAEIEAARHNTLTEDIPEDPVKLYEFNNHLFASQTFPQGTLCEHCNEVLYGIKDQGFECRDCKMVVHKSCYVLGDVSCEMYTALKTGETHYVMMRSIEEKEKLIQKMR
ncbi:Serine/threonine-protein kinase MRCK alpha, partial [Nosema granulosis]